MASCLTQTLLLHSEVMVGCRKQRGVCRLAVTLKPCEHANSLLCLFERFCMAAKIGKDCGHVERHVHGDVVLDHNCMTLLSDALQAGWRATRSGAKRRPVPVLANRNESRDSSRDIRNAPVSLISGLPAVSNHVLALAALLAKRSNEARSSRPICSSDPSMRTWGDLYGAQKFHREDDARAPGGHRFGSGKFWAGPLRLHGP